MGKKNISNKLNKSERINQFGMTGCLSFYNYYFNAIINSTPTLFVRIVLNIVSSKVIYKNYY